MNTRSEIQNLIENMPESHVETLAGIISRMVGVTADSWTGKITFELNANQGHFGDTHVNKSEIIRTAKKRRVRG